MSEKKELLKLPNGEDVDPDTITCIRKAPKESFPSGTNLEDRLIIATTKDHLVVSANDIGHAQEMADQIAGENFKVTEIK